MPKTRASSSRELAALLDPDVNIDDYNDSERSFDERMDVAVNAFIAEAKSEGTRSARPYSGPARAADQREPADTCAVTMLRDPVDRIVSDYRYQRSPAHPPSADHPRRSRHRRLPSDRFQQNKTARHLLPYPMVADGDPERAIEYILANYDFVGVQEMYPLSFGILTAMIGKPRPPSLRKNVNPEASTSVEINDDLVKSVREVNRLDAAIYAYFAGRLAAVQEVLSRDLAKLGADAQR